MEDGLINFLKKILEKKIHTLSGFFIGFLLLSIIFIFLLPLIEKIFREKWYYSYIFVLVIWLAVWIFIKYHLPKNKKNKVGLCFLIYTESKKEEFQLKRDFIDHLKRKLDEHGLLKLVTVLEVRNHFAKKIQEISEENKKIKTLKKWNEKIGAHFLVWGDVRRRRDEGGKIFLELDSMVYHAPMPDIIKEEFRREMLSVFQREISFLEKAEFKGFRASADLISIATQYIVGISALWSGNPFLALKLHFGLLRISNKIKGITPEPNLEVIKEKTQKIISREFSTITRYYYVKKDLERMFKFINKALEFDNENYTAYLLLAIYHFLKNRNMKASFGALRLASKFSNGDSAWEYSEAFLHCYNGNLDKASTCYVKAFRGELPESEKFLKDIISFIEEIIEKEPDKIQLYFALGKIYYQKLYNLPEASRNYEKFLLAADPADPRFTKKIELVRDYKEKIDERLMCGF